jgi:hypothetical protein
VQTLCRPRLPLWVLKKYSQTNNRDSWYGRPESLLAQNLQKLKKTGKKTSLLKLPKNIPRKPRDFPQYGRQFYCGGKSPYGLVNRVILCMKI